jgi:hypothetical protein
MWKTRETVYVGPPVSVHVGVATDFTRAQRHYMYICVWNYYPDQSGSVERTGRELSARVTRV